MKFYKYQGLGNDFIFLEPNATLKLDAARLCDRHFGIGADGVITIKKLERDHFEMRIYNADGTETQMCGNATRCAAKFIRTQQLSKASEVTLHTLGGEVKPKLLDNGMVRVDMGLPRLLRGQIPVAGPASEEAHALQLQACGKSFTAFCVSMGNPHAVIFVDNIDEIDLPRWGAALELDRNFPQKTNVEFVQVLDANRMRMRVWERGCGITLACGTGSCATAVAGFLSGRTARRVEIILDGGQLEIEYDLNTRHVHMTGDAQPVFCGELFTKEK